MKKKFLTVVCGVLVLLGTISVSESKADGLEDIEKRGDWVVKIANAEKMTCSGGGQSDCPIRWFLKNKLTKKE